MSDYWRIPEDEYASKFTRCSVCNSYIEIARTREGGKYESPYPTIKGCTFTVYGRCAIQLAGQANGDTLGDTSTTSPQCSPALLDIDLVAGESIIFTVSGAFGTQSNADGDTSSIISVTAGDQNSISDLTAPQDSLVGVFITDSVPSGTAPTALDFTLLATRDYTTLSPSIRQVFYIGTGRTADDAYRQVVVPATATRLYVGCHDSASWNINTGTITGSCHQSKHFNHVDSITTSGIYLNDTAASYGCPTCGSPAWRTGGRPGDLR